jgi:hypothetical protein
MADGLISRVLAKTQWDSKNSVGHNSHSKKRHNLQPDYAMLNIDP